MYVLLASFNGRLHGVLLEALLGELGEHLQDGLLDLRGVLLRDVLEAHAEDRLVEAVVQAAADDAGAEAAVHQGLVERGGRRAHEEVVQEGEREVGLEVRLPLIDDPVDAHHVLLRDVLVLAHREVADDALGLGEEGLRPDDRVDLDAEV